MEKKYWKGLEELNNDAEFVRLKNNEFAELLPIEAIGGKSSSSDGGTNRRDFLKFLGFGVAAATLASCEAPVKKTIPYLIKPEEITPGVANWYASSFYDGEDYCSILVKTREGRPIKIEGNKSSSITRGGTSARVQASVLDLYDSGRLKGPLSGKNPSSWDVVDKDIKEKLSAATSKGGKVVILSSTVISPSLKAAIAEFTGKTGAKVVTYDAVSYSAMIAANQESFGKAVIPSYNFEKTNTIVSFGADFLANWLSPIEHANQYSKNRKLNKGQNKMSKHFQFESALSVSGSNADKRVALKPSEQAMAIAALYNKIAGMAGSSSVSAGVLEPRVSTVVEEAAKALWANKGKSIVLAGANDKHAQMFANAINSMLENYGSTIDLDNYSNLHQGNDGELVTLLEDMNKGQVGALFMYNTNPVYTLPGFKAALAKVTLKVSFADREDETASLCDFVCPDHHYLEAWTDAEPKKGFYSLGQPTISPLFNTRSAIETFLTWAGNNTDAHSYISAHWKNNMMGQQNKHSMFDSFWNTTLQDGVMEGTASAGSSAKFSKDLSEAGTAVSKYKNDGIELALYVKTGLGNGSRANNPWLQELPDPITRICWDNYASVSPKFAKELGVKQTDIVELTVNGIKVEAPIVVQPGQADKTIALAVGYGRTATGKAGNNVGVNAYPFVSLATGMQSYTINGVKVNKTGREMLLAATQTQHTMMGREIVKETSLEEWTKDPRAGNEKVLIQTWEGKKSPEEVNFWESHDKPNHKWALAIDLNSCIGCGACVVSCNAENNVPVVGKDEISRSRDMHWIRIDRYYSSDEEKSTSDSKDLRKLEIPSSEDPQVVFQPVMCQHCNHAPCETVCPVAATTHSSEGLNQMAYNRCVGTRYCANNCPYKVRRFNWFKYSDNSKFDFNMNDDLGKMVLNPDVVVRSRGVMEKCTMCVQRIQAGKLDAKKESRRPKDGEIQTACSQACPTNAIIFGDLNDKDSMVSGMFKEDRSYHLLEELDTQPSVFYQTKVRNA